MKFYMKRDKSYFFNLFYVFDENSEIKYESKMKSNLGFSKIMILVDSFGKNVATIKKFSFPLLGVYFIKVGNIDLVLIENKTNSKPVYYINRGDYVFKNGLKPYCFSIEARDFEILMVQYKDAFDNFNIEIFEEKFEVLGICVSICVNDIIISENKIRKLV